MYAILSVIFFCVQERADPRCHRISPERCLQDVSFFSLQSRWLLVNASVRVERSLSSIFFYILSFKRKLAADGDVSDRSISEAIGKVIHSVQSKRLLDTLNQYLSSDGDDIMPGHVPSDVRLAEPLEVYIMSSLLSNTIFKFLWHGISGGAMSTMRKCCGGI